MSQAWSTTNQQPVSAKIVPFNYNDSPTALPLAVPLKVPSQSQHVYRPSEHDDAPNVVPMAVPIPPPIEKTPLNSTQIRTLQEQGFTKGLCSSLETSKESFPLRIWIVDNSGSMQMADGNRLVETSSRKDFRCVPCSRWDEIKECVKYHAQMAALLEAPTQFRLLNNPGIPSGQGFNSQLLSIAEGDPSTIPSEMRHVLDVMNQSSPVGVTPLTRHIREIREYVQQMMPLLNESGQRVVIVIATDGLPSDEQGRSTSHERQQFVQALRSLEGMPVWVVVRLCTDEDDVVEFYGDLDGQLELSLEVLDDFIGEAKEVYGHNPWINYSLPLHRLREMGFYNRLFDLIGERPFTRSEVRDFCSFLFGRDKMDGVADPEGNWDGFVRHVERLTKAEKSQWDPMKKRMSPVVNMKKMKKMYGKKGLFGMLKR